MLLKDVLSYCTNIFWYKYVSLLYTTNKLCTLRSSLLRELGLNTRSNNSNKILVNNWLFETQIIRGQRSKKGEKSPK